MHLPDIVTTSLGWLAFEFARVQPLLPTYGHLLISALFPIFAGSYASLSRPSSAAKPEKAKKSDDGSEDEEEEEIKMEGLSPQDAIIFPVLAGVTLTGLYFVIKWLEDPALLNKILNWYFAAFSVFSVSKLVSDSLDVLHSFLFPHDYVDGGVLYHVEPKHKRAVSKDTAIISTRSTPLPGIFSRIPLPQVLMNLFWTLHVLPNRKLNLSGFLQGFGSFKLALGIHGIEGLIVGLTTVLYYNLVSKPWYLTNLMGFGFAYGALQLMSPTTFTTGTMLLGALLCYDFYMVFRTPMMVTVAKSLDIPIKLLFPRPPDARDDPAKKALSMLGLGDVVLPGIMIGLALRFDLYLYYLRKQTKSTRTTNISSTELSIEENDKEPTVATVSTDIIKAPYTPVTEAWGDGFWTTSILPFYRNSIAAQTYTARNAFPKPYFYAGISGYVVGMLSTLAAMQISSHPQPALIYLVPGVLVALWGTAAVRGEVREMWAFSDAEEDEDQKEKEQEQKKKTDKTEVDAGNEDSEGNIKTENTMTAEAKDEKSTARGPRTSIFSTARADQRSKAFDKYFNNDDNTNARDKSSSKQGRTLISFSVTAPLAYWPEESDSSRKNDADVKDDGERVVDVPATPHKEGEHVEKRRRIH